MARVGVEPSASCSASGRLVFVVNIGEQETENADGEAPPQVHSDEPPKGATHWHSLNFTRIVWNGLHWKLSPMQRVIVRRLWPAWMAGSPAIPWRELRIACGSHSERLTDLFKKGSHKWQDLVECIGNDRWQLVGADQIEPPSATPTTTCPEPCQF